MIEKKKSKIYRAFRCESFDENESEKDKKFEKRKFDTQLKSIVRWWTIIEMTIIEISNIDAVVHILFQIVENQFQIRFQILSDENFEMYSRIKKFIDCRFDVMSQCMQIAHVIKNNSQYHFNVCMKFNVKLNEIIRVARKNVIYQSNL